MHPLLATLHWVACSNTVVVKWLLSAPFAVRHRHQHRRHCSQKPAMQSRPFKSGWGRDGMLGWYIYILYIIDRLHVTTCRKWKRYKRFQSMLSFIRTLFNTFMSLFFSHLLMVCCSPNEKGENGKFR